MRSRPATAGPERERSPEQPGPKGNAPNRSLCVDAVGTIGSRVWTGHRATQLLPDPLCPRPFPDLRLSRRCRDFPVGHLALRVPLFDCPTGDIARSGIREVPAISADSNKSRICGILPVGQRRSSSILPCSFRWDTFRAAGGVASTPRCGPVFLSWSSSSRGREKRKPPRRPRNHRSEHAWHEALSLFERWFRVSQPGG